ncbi:MBL fold metallo-hydrolase [Halobacteria archaeon AArc-curdl1]|uniref:MBL fold metallo-hydrolase n=1 Tax=Natronosalvus hydrolyticus TaxID=2979988 RepID=A0AAP3E643_9EURY|nr:MBL fold metallo-hydrolase [Halobacteria archaeon AArc-curdl1]
MIVNLSEGIQAFTSNVFLVDGERTVLVDTGANFDVVERIHEHTDTLDAVVLTHTHLDHVDNLEAVLTAFDVEVWGHDESFAGIDHALEDEGSITMGDHQYVTYHTPGHKGDHLCLYAEDPQVLFAGDLVFQNGSFGRTDLPEGDRATLIESIDRMLEVLDPSLRELHTGHGPSVTTDPYRHVELASQMARQH